MAKLGEYYAVALIEIARQQNDGIVVRRDSLRERLESHWNIKAAEEDLSDAVRILHRCDIAYTDEDEFAGVFIVINEPRYQSFLERVAKERDEYDSIVKSADDLNYGINRAEEAYLPHLEAYGTFKVLKKYSAFGGEWLLTAMEEIRRRSIANELEIPASDRIVKVDHNDPAYVEIRQAAEELQSRLKTSNDLGELTPDQAAAAANEVEQIKDALSRDVVRPSELSQRAGKTLKWIGEKAAGTFVGQAATSLFRAIMNFFGIPI